MPSLFFPNLNALRLVLSSGLLPFSLTQKPTNAGTDQLNAIWFEVPELPSRELIASLARVGVQAQGSITFTTEQVSCWAELLHLRKKHAPAADTVLFIGPDRAAAQFVRKLRQATRNPIAVSLPDSPLVRTAWITTRAPSPRFLTELIECNSPFEAYTEQIPGVWVKFGWEHPLANLLVLQPNSILLLREPNRVVLANNQLPLPKNEEFRLRKSPKTLRPSHSTVKSIPIALHLSPRQTSARETLWILEGADAAEFWNTCGVMDERFLRRLDVATQQNGGNRRIIIRSSSNIRSALFPPLSATAYSQDARLPGLFIPANKTLRPQIRIDVLSKSLAVGPGRIAWLQPLPDGSTLPLSISASGFFPLSERMRYTSTPEVKLKVETDLDPFPLNRIHLTNESIPNGEFDEPIPIEQAEEETQPEIEAGHNHGGFMQSLSRFLMKRGRSKRAADSSQSKTSRVEEKAETPASNRNESSVASSGTTTANSETDEHTAWLPRLLKKWMSRSNEPDDDAQTETGTEVDSGAPSPIDRRVQQTLSSQEALRHGPDWALRRSQMEMGLLENLPHQDSESRARQWSALANVYSKLGNASDAAVCWMNAVWETPIPPLAWLKQWFASECQSAKLNESQCVLERWLSERQPGIARVVAAYATIAWHTQTSAELLPALPRILAFLDQHCEDLPVRSAWLARLAATRACDGDALGLARWRDRLLDRLVERGPGLDLDEPSFLRFHGSVSGERFQAARKWVESVREKVRDWINGHGRPNGRYQSDRLLQWAGLVAEKDATAAYADFMLAWGLGGLGERIQANNWAAQARKRLLGTIAPGVDPAAHALLADLFLYRVKEAQEGRIPKASLPSELQQRNDALPDFARFAVDRLREHSQILEPRDNIRSFRGRELRDLWGSDRLGERLFLLAERSSDEQLAEEAETLLQLCNTSPATNTVPRIILTLLEIAPRLDQSTQLRVLSLLPTALDWLEPWIAAGRWSFAEQRERLNRYRTRMIKAGFGVAASLDPQFVGSIFASLIRQMRQTGPSVRDSLLGASPQIFRALRRLGLKNEAETLVQFLDTERSRHEVNSRESPISRLNLAIGWLTVGNEDVGWRILDDTSKLLYLTPDLDVNERTNLAIAYAEALGFAPPGLALGRLGELFERLDKVKETGSTNRYYTLKPLQLIDAIVRSVVTDEFALCPTIRSWLDDDEFLIRGRIHRDLNSVLHEQGLG